MLNLGGFKLLKTDIWAIDYDYILDEIQNHIKSKKSLLISPLASQTFVQAYYDKKLMNILNAYNILFSDSLWVKRAINFLYKINLNERIRGTNFTLNVCKLSSQKGYRIFLYGTTLDTLEKLKSKLLAINPKLKIVGFVPSKFASLTDSEKRSLIDKIKKLQTDVLFVALGSPLQEIFAYQFIFEIPRYNKNIVIIPVGAAFDYISGVKPTAPKWMQDTGLEWFFRLLCEPRRLWKRYLVYGPIFVFLVLVQKYQMLVKPYLRPINRS